MQILTPAVVLSSDFISTQFKLHESSVQTLISALNVKFISFAFAMQVHADIDASQYNLMSKLEQDFVMRPDLEEAVQSVNQAVDNAQEKVRKGY